MAQSIVFQPHLQSQDPLGLLLELHHTFDSSNIPCISRALGKAQKFKVKGPVVWGKGPKVLRLNKLGSISSDRNLLVIMPSRLLCRHLNVCGPRTCPSHGRTGAGLSGLWVTPSSRLSPPSASVRWGQCRVWPAWRRRTTLWASFCSSPASWRNGTSTCLSSCGMSRWGLRPHFLEGSGQMLGDGVVGTSSGPVLERGLFA